MQYRTLGQSKIQASTIGLGTWAIGGWMWGGADERDSIAAIHASLDAGVSLIDTAPVYGFGLSEEIVGKAIQGRRDKVVLATKCGMVCNPTVGEPKFRVNTIAPDPLGHIHVHIYLGPESIRKELEASLQRLGTDYVDLYQTHWQDPTTPIRETMGVLMDLKNEGKIRAIGVSNASAQQMKEYLECGAIDSDQEKYSMLDRQIEQDQCPFCLSHDIALLGYSPLAQGLLTGKMDPSREFDKGDLRYGNERFSRENRERIAHMLDAFRPIAESRGLSLAQLAIAWTLQQPCLTHVLCGARNTQQAQENAAAGDVELSSEERSIINEAIQEHLGARV